MEDPKGVLEGGQKGHLRIWAAPGLPAPRGEYELGARSWRGGQGARQTLASPPQPQPAGYLSGFSLGLCNPGTGRGSWVSERRSRGGKGKERRGGAGVGDGGGKRRHASSFWAP